MPMTEQDFIPRHFIQMTNVVQPSADEPGEPVGAACPPVPEPSASASECPEDPEQPPTPRDPFVDNPQDSVEIELYAESWDSTLPGTSGELAQRVAQLERELTEKNERMAVLESTVDKFDDLKDDLTTAMAQGHRWARKCQEEMNQL